MNLLDAASPISGFPVLDGIHQSHGIRGTLQEILRLLDNVRLDSASLIAWLNGLSQKELTIVCARSVERASHFKWFLGESARAM